jgi:hypothetical protein
LNKPKIHRGKHSTGQAGQAGWRFIGLENKAKGQRKKDTIDDRLFLMKPFFIFIKLASIDDILIVDIIIQIC